MPWSLQRLRCHKQRQKDEAEVHSGLLAELIKNAALEEARIEHHHRQPIHIFRRHALLGGERMGARHTQDRLVAAHFYAIPAWRNPCDSPACLCRWRRSRASLAPRRRSLPWP